MSLQDGPTTPTWSCFPSHQFGKVRDRSDRTTEKRKDREKKESHTSPWPGKIPASRTARGPGGPVTQQGGGRTHHTSTVHQPTRIHMRHTTPRPPHPPWASRAHKCTSASPSNRISTEGRRPPTPGRREGGVRFANDRHAGAPAVRSLPHAKGRREKAKTHNHHREEGGVGATKQKTPYENWENPGPDQHGYVLYAIVDGNRTRRRWHSLCPPKTF